MAPAEYYQDHIVLYTQRLKMIHKRRNLITAAKLLTFTGLIFQIYWFITTSTFSVLFPAGLIFLFILLTSVDTKMIRQQQLTEQLIEINRNENDYLSGNLSSFPTGSNYQTPTHPYAADLDLFGEDSLFQHINRTVTSQGTHLLVNWLLQLSQDPPTIRQRQHAVSELTSSTEWCHYFRAAGLLHPTQDIDFQILKKFQTSPSFFRHPKFTRTLLYISNGITLLGWTLSIFNMIPWAFPLLFSFIQLLTLTLFLKK